MVRLSYAGYDSGGSFTGYHMHTAYEVNCAIDWADGLSFDIYLSTGKTCSINGWLISVDKFNTVNGEFNDQVNNLHVHCSDPNPLSGLIVLYEKVTVSVTLYSKLDVCTNKMNISNVWWTQSMVPKYEIPCFEWEVVLPGSETVLVRNKHPTISILACSFVYRPDLVFFADPKTVAYTGPIPGNFTINPELSKDYQLALAPINNGYLHFTCTIRNTTGFQMMTFYAIHGNMTHAHSIGGIRADIVKTGLPIPQIGLACLTIGTLVSAAIIVRHKKLEKRTQEEWIRQTKTCLLFSGKKRAGYSSGLYDT
jgi:hypothetical protein